MGDEIVIDASFSELHKPVPEVIQERVFALREQNRVYKIFLIMKMIEDVSDEMLVIEDGGFREIMAPLFFHGVREDVTENRGANRLQ